MSKRSIGFILVLSLSLFCLPMQAQFEHPDVKSGKIKPAKLLMMPPQVQVVRMGMKSNEGLIEESQQVEQAIPGIINRVFTDRGSSAVMTAPEASCWMMATPPIDCPTAPAGRIIARFVMKSCKL